MPIDITLTIPDNSATLMPSTNGSHLPRRRGLLQIQAAVAVCFLIAMSGCAELTRGPDLPSARHHSTPDRSQIVIADDQPPDGLTDPRAVAAYRQGYDHMLDGAWYSAIVAYDEVIRIQPQVAGTYNAKLKPR